MTAPTDPTAAARRLAEPDVTPAELAAIARDVPELRHVVAAHPAAYPALREWISAVTPSVPPPPPAQPSAPVPVQPPPSAGVPVEPGTGPVAAQAGGARGRRVSPAWVVACVAVLVAVVAVGVSVLGRGAASATERGSDSPEDAVSYVVERLAEGDLGGASQAFAVESLADGFSFELSVDRQRAVTPMTWLPSDEAGYRAVNRDLRRGEVASMLRTFVTSVVAPHREPGMTVSLEDDFTAADAAAELAPGPLGSLEALSIDEVVRTEPQYAENADALAAVYGADELKEFGVLYRTPDGTAMGGMTVVRFGDSWYVWTLSSPILGTAFAGLEPMSPEEYSSAVAGD